MRWRRPGGAEVPAPGTFNERAGSAFAGFWSELAYRAVEKASDIGWNIKGGPWIAQYNRSALVRSIGFPNSQHKVHFRSPQAALEYFESPKFDRHRRNHTLRESCLIVYGSNWYAVEPFADDAHRRVELMVDEVARDLGKTRQQLVRPQKGPSRREARKALRQGHRPDDVNDSGGWTSALSWTWFSGGGDS